MPFDSNLSLGQFLRQERERRGITIEQVASATKVGVRTLHLLEADNYCDLPAKPFIRGFVTSYARFIGLDHKEVLTHYSSFLEEKLQERPRRDSGHSGYAFEKREGDQSRVFLGATMGGFVVIGAVAFVLFKPSLHHHHGSHIDKLRASHGGEGPLALASGVPGEQEALVGPVQPSSSASTGTAPASVVASATPSATPSSKFTAAVAVANPVITPTVTPTVAPPAVVVTPTATAKPTPVAEASSVPSPAPTPTQADPLNSGLGLKPSEIAHRLVAKASESVWVRYKVDDKPVMQFVLKKDKILVLRARKELVFQVAKPENISLSHNGAGYLPGTGFKSMVQRQNDATVFYPAQLADSTQEPFPNTKPLSSRPAPISPASVPTPAPTP